jgi:hypothetical protein
VLHSRYTPDAGERADDLRRQRPAGRRRQGSAVFSVVISGPRRRAPTVGFVSGSVLCPGGAFVVRYILTFIDRI